MTTSQYIRQIAAEAPGRASRAHWWTMPFSVGTWRRTLYILLAFPVSLVALSAVLLGGYRPAARLQQGLARRYLPLRDSGPAPRDRAGRVLAYTVLSLPLNLGSLGLTVYLWSLVPANLAYPLRPGTTDSYQHSWGGPSPAGAWAVHAAAGVVFLFATPLVVKGITWLQGRLMDGLLGGGS